MDNRLDFISKFVNEDEAHHDMATLRNRFIDLDKSLMAIWKTCGNLPGQRAIALARTNLETSLQYAIKGLCLKHEKTD